MTQNNVAHLRFVTTLGPSKIHYINEGFHKGTCNSFENVQCKRSDLSPEHPPTDPSYPSPPPTS